MRRATFACLGLITNAARANGGMVRLYAAYSLRLALTAVAQGFTAAHGIWVEAAFGSSGKLRQWLENELAILARQRSEAPLTVR